MQKNNLCPLSNKILTYEESDSFSQSNFNENKLPFGPSKKKAEQIKQKYFSAISTKINQIPSNNININKNIPQKFHSNNYNKKKEKIKSLYQIFKDSYKYFNKKNKIVLELNYYIYSINFFIRKYKTFNDEYLEQFFSYTDSIQIIPKKEFYFYHHMLFLERPNFNDNYFNQIKKNMCLKKLDIYQNQRKKEYKLDQINNNKNSNNNIEIENENKKIFDTNVLETIENYSTTMTQEPNNEKQKALTPSEIFKLCEDKNNKKKIVHKNNDQKSIITFSESEISYKSKNIVDESMISVIKELSEKQNKFKIYKQEKKYTNLFIKKKDIQKFEKYNNNIHKNNKNNNYNYNNKNYKNKNMNNNFINNDKDIINKKKVSTSTNKKAQKINFDDIYHNTISKSSSKRASFINNTLSNKTEENKKANFTSFGTTIRKNKGVLNLKKESYKLKNHATLFSDNYLMNDNSNLNNNINSLNSIISINNVNSNTNSKLVSTSCSSIDKLLTFFLNPNKKNNNNSQNKYEEFNFFNIKKGHMKKKTTLTIVNNTLINKSQNSKDKFKKISKNSNFKSKSPLTRLFLKKNEYKSNDKKNNIYKKKKSILTCEIEHNSQLAKSVNKLNFEKNSNTNKKTINENKNISSNTIYNNIFNKNNKHLNIMSLNQANVVNRRNSYQFMKLKKNSAKSKLNK